MFVPHVPVQVEFFELGKPAEAEKTDETPTRPAEEKKEETPAMSEEKKKEEYINRS